MPDETPTGDRAVYVFIEMIALGFVLYAIEEAFRDNRSWPKVWIALCLGIMFFLIGINWGHLRARFNFRWIHKVDFIANDYRYRYGIMLLLIGIAGVYVISSLHSLRADFDAYNAPRTITQQQAEKLKDYLSKCDSFAVTIKVVLHDDEAMGYAGQLFNAMVQTNWDIDPPNHDGPAPFRLNPYMRRPEQNDVDANGKRLFKTFDEYMNAHDEWIKLEIQRQIDEATYSARGLSIQVEQAGQPQNPDPRHPTPDAVLTNALRYAGIELDGSGGSFNKNKYAVYLLVGHRPMLRNSEPLRYKIVRWVNDWMR